MRLWEDVPEEERITREEVALCFGTFGPERKKWIARTMEDWPGRCTAAVRWPCQQFRRPLWARCKNKVKVREGSGGFCYPHDPKMAKQRRSAAAYAWTRRQLRARSAGLKEGM